MRFGPFRSSKSVLPSRSNLYTRQPLAFHPLYSSCTYYAFGKLAQKGSTMLSHCNFLWGSIPHRQLLYKEQDTHWFSKVNVQYQYQYQYRVNFYAMRITGSTMLSYCNFLWGPIPHRQLLYKEQDTHWFSKVNVRSNRTALEDSLTFC